MVSAVPGHIPPLIFLRVIYGEYFSTLGPRNCYALVCLIKKPPSDARCQFSTEISNRIVSNVSEIQTKVVKMEIEKILSEAYINGDICELRTSFWEIANFLQNLLLLREKPTDIILWNIQ